MRCPLTIAFFAPSSLEQHWDIILTLFEKNRNISTIVWHQFHRKKNEYNITDGEQMISLQYSRKQGQKHMIILRFTSTSARTQRFITKSLQTKGTLQLVRSSCRHG
jgi:hypothetical protein